MKAALVIMAAGLGSRYGGNKQVDGVGPRGEMLMEYSIYDAVRAGFTKVVFIIKPDMRELMDRLWGDRTLITKTGEPLEVCYAMQDFTSIPDYYTIPAGRTKPFGTAHAVLCARPYLSEPFCVINADDYYGADGFRVLADFLRSVEGEKGRWCMVGFNIENTLSENGGVSRGLCEVNGEGYLTGVTECHGIERKDGRLVQVNAEGQTVPFPENASVSMNMWGFTPDYFDYSEKAFVDFLSEHGGELKSEFYIPSVVNDLINAGEVTLKVEPTTSKWFGVTYAADRDATVAQFRRLVDAGIYPTPLF